jgi:hypothetical protein
MKTKPRPPRRASGKNPSGSPSASAAPAWREETVGRARIYTRPVSQTTMARMPPAGKLRPQLPWWELLFAKPR